MRLCHCSIILINELLQEGSLTTRKETCRAQTLQNIADIIMMLHHAKISLTTHPVWQGAHRCCMRVTSRIYNYTFSGGGGGGGGECFL